MNTYFSIFVALFILVLSVWVSIINKSTHMNLVIGILSARGNIEKRRVIRHALKTQIENEKLDVIFKFILGRKPCNLSIAERIDSYGCEPASYVPSVNNIYTSHSLDIVSNIETISEFEQFGWDFVLTQDVTIEEIGFFDYLEDGIKGTVKVSVYNRLSKEPILAVVFLSFSPGVLKNSFRFKQVLRTTFPKGFRGTLVAEGISNEDPILFNTSCFLDTRSTVLKIQNVFRFGSNTEIFSEFKVTKVKNPCFYVGTTFKFSSNITRDHQLKESHEQNLEKESTIINQESAKYNDIIFVDTIDIYRNLPVKMLKFYKWLYNHAPFNYQFVMKSDDDCFINITGVMHRIYPLSHKQNLWLGNFREYFGVHKEGKWAELDYKAVSYPPFACGSGYVLSSSIVRWVAENENQLKLYQGEDTSLGIWLSAIKHRRILSERFYCMQTCNNEMLTLPENSKHQLKCLYENFNKTNICDICFP